MLDSSGLEPEVARSARSDVLTEAEAKQLLASVDRVIVCRGRKTFEIPVVEAGPEQLKGPTGNFRAPLLQLDDALLVGFNQQALTDLIG